MPGPFVFSGSPVGRGAYDVGRSAMGDPGGMEAAARTPVVLLIDDSASDRRIAADALAACGMEVELHEAVDGARGLAFLRREGEHADAPRPDVVLLDLRMPGLDGGEVLEAIAADPDLRTLRVVVQTTSDDDVDVVKVWELGAVHFVRKPVDAAADGGRARHGPGRRRPHVVVSAPP